MYPLCINFTMLDPSKDGKVDFLVLMDAFLSSVTPLWHQIRRPLLLQNCSWTNGFMYKDYQHIYIVKKAKSLKTKYWKKIYAMYNIKQSTSIPCNLHRNSQCERFNCKLQDLLRTLLKEQKKNWPLDPLRLILACNATPHSTSGFQPYWCLATKLLLLVMAG